MKFLRREPSIVAGGGRGSANVYLTETGRNITVDIYRKKKFNIFENTNI